MKKPLTLSELRQLVEHNELVARGQGVKAELLAQFDLVDGKQYRDLEDHFDRVIAQRDEARALAQLRLRWKEGYERRGKKIRDQRKEIRDLHKSHVRGADKSYIDFIRREVDALDGIDGDRGTLIKALQVVIRRYNVVKLRQDGDCPTAPEMVEAVQALIDMLND